MIHPLIHVFTRQRSFYTQKIPEVAEDSSGVESALWDLRGLAAAVAGDLLDRLHAHLSSTGQCDKDHPGGELGDVNKFRSVRNAGLRTWYKNEMQEWNHQHPSKQKLNKKHYKTTSNTSAALSFFSALLVPLRPSSSWRGAGRGWPAPATWRPSGLPRPWGSCFHQTCYNQFSCQVVFLVVLEKKICLWNSSCLFFLFFEGGNYMFKWNIRPLFCFSAEQLMRPAEKFVRQDWFAAVCGGLSQTAWIPEWNVRKTGGLDISHVWNISSWKTYHPGKCDDVTFLTLFKRTLPVFRWWS